MIYLDHAATTPLADVAWAAMEPFLRTHFGNASEPHAAGRAARSGLAAARQTVAEGLGVRPHDVAFCAGGTEADNLVVLGRAQGGSGRIVVSAIEHPAVGRACAALARRGFEVAVAPVDADGVVDAGALRDLLAPGAALCCVMWANNVTGTVQPIAAVAGLCAERGVPLHVDAVQAASGIDIDVGALPGDVTVALAAHKLGGPKAVGVLAGRGLRSLAPVLHGGGQERGLRPGTENVAGAVAMAAVLERRQGAGAPAERAARRARRDRLEAACGVAVAGAGAERLPGHACLLCDDVRGDVLVHVLDAEGFCVAAGSACAAGSAEPSPVLTAMGLDARQARSALRVSIGPETTDDDVDAFVPALRGALATLRVAAAGVA